MVFIEEQNKFWEKVKILKEKIADFEIGLAKLNGKMAEGDKRLESLRISQKEEEDKMEKLRVRIENLNCVIENLTKITCVMCHRDM